MVLDSLLVTSVLTALWLLALAAAVVGYRYPSATDVFGRRIEPLVVRIGNELWIATALLWSGFFLARLGDRGVGPSSRGLFAIGTVVNLAGVAILGWIGWQWVRNR